MRKYSFPYHHVQEAMETLLPYFTRNAQLADHLRNSLHVTCRELPFPQKYTANLRHIVVPPEQAHTPLYTNIVVGEEVTHFLHANTNSVVGHRFQTGISNPPLEALIEYVGFYGARTHLQSKRIPMPTMAFEINGKHVLQPLANLKYDVRGPSDLSALAKFTHIDQLIKFYGGLPQTFLNEIYR